ncbi:hypothetical protein [Streptomyces sp. NPDC051109]|uniref:hypothetical protein n=1 Tax=Streptomyces sp. NPDC051109 TaxID=3365642 RepID=UPI00379005DC
MAGKRTRWRGVVAAALGGAVAGCLARDLAADARASCDAGREAGGRFELFFEMLLLVPGCAVLALLVWLPARRVNPAVGGVAAVVLVLSVVVVWYFATQGTPDGYRGESGPCGPDNVPPWWPAWLPSCLVKTGVRGEAVRAIMGHDLDVHP